MMPVPFVARVHGPAGPEEVFAAFFCSLAILAMFLWATRSWRRRD